MTIINTIESSYTGLAVTALILAFMFFICFLYLIINEQSIVLIFACFSMCVLFTYLSISSFNRPNKIQYEVLIDDNYSANDLLKNYEIIGQRGDSWILEDKNK